MSRPTTQIEALLYDRRVHIAAACVAVVVLLMSVGLLFAAKSPSRFKALAAHLPDQPLNIPIMRSLPEPIEMKGARTVSAPGRSFPRCQFGAAPCLRSSPLVVTKPAPALAHR